jgi:hypothetical protein
MPLRALVLAILNRKGWVEQRRTVVEAYLLPMKNEVSS